MQRENFMEPTDYYSLLEAIQKQVTRHKVFISYHHNDQIFKEALLVMNKANDIFIDYSVDTGDIDEDLDDQTIREKIRDEYLRDSTVTIVLVGAQTKERKHVDWEIYASMRDSKINKKSGIFVVNLPNINCSFFSTRHEGEKERLYPEEKGWISISNRAEYERRYPFMPARIIDNLLFKDAKISVVNWDKILNRPENLRFLIEATHRDKAYIEYDLSRSMRRKNR
jgi:hypothetical protein